MLRSLFFWDRPGRPSRTIGIDEVFNVRYRPTIILSDFTEKDYFDSLCLMHGDTPICHMLWDWHDEMWDRVHSRGSDRIHLGEVFNHVLYPDRNLFKLFDKPMQVSRIHRDALMRRDGPYRKRTEFIVDYHIRRI